MALNKIRYMNTRLMHFNYDYKIPLFYLNVP